MKSKQICPECKVEFVQIGNHWQYHGDHRPTITDRQHSIIRGLMMGDGCLDRSSTNPRIIVGSGKRQFLQWISGEFGVLGGDVRIYKTDDELKERNRNAGMVVSDDSDYQNAYVVDIKNHPTFSGYTSWYENGTVTGFSLDSLAVKVWYVSDGTLAWDVGGSTPRVQIRSCTPKFDTEYVCDYLNSEGFTATYSSGTFYLKCSETSSFLKWIGEPLPGYEYLWEFGDRDVFNEVRDKCR